MEARQAARILAFLPHSLLGRVRLPLTCAARSQRVRVASTVLLSLFASRPSLAQSARPYDDAPQVDIAPRESRSQRTTLTGDRIALLAHLGIAPPGGVLGADLDVAPIRNLAVNVSAGISPGGFQAGVTPRVRVALSRRVFMGWGTGVSLGRYVDDGRGGLGPGEPAAPQTWDPAYWHHLELAIDLYAKRGRGLAQFVVGASHLLNPTAFSCGPTRPDEFAPHLDCGRRTPSWLGFVSVAYGFDL